MTKFKDAQNAFIAKQGDEGTPVAEICRKAGINQAAYLNCKKRYAGLVPSVPSRQRRAKARAGLAAAHDSRTKLRLGFRLP